MCLEGVDYESSVNAINKEGGGLTDFIYETNDIAAL